MLVIGLFLFFKLSDSARILGVVPTPSYSHQIVFQPIWKELSLRGHQVVSLTPDPINDPNLVNLTEIDLKFAYDVWNKYITEATNTTGLGSIFVMAEAFYKVNDYILSHPDVQSLIKNNTEYFDVVIIEYTLHSMLAFAERFKAPIIIGSSVESTIDVHHIMGNPIHMMLYPPWLSSMPYDLLFPNRILLLLITVFSKLFVLQYHAVQNEKIKTFFGDDYPSVAELTQNISLVLSNSDPIFHKVKPLLPNIVEFGGGSHRVAPKPLPKKLKKILDAAENGFIYFSLGSNVKTNTLPKRMLNVILDTFAELPYTVLWKLDESLPNELNNVVTSKWFPQQDVIKHPNIKLFITQGGLQSIDEALYDYVPMLIMPFFGDQRFNAHRMVAKGCALSIDYETMTKDEFKTAILELIDNPKYKNRIMELAKLAQDQPMSGIEKAVWWIEYVIRHKGTAHLRSPYLDMPAYQYYYLDMIAVFGLAFLILIGIFVGIVKLLLKAFSFLFRKKTKPKAE